MLKQPLVNHVLQKSKQYAKFYNLGPQTPVYAFAKATLGIYVLSSLSFSLTLAILHHRNQIDHINPIILRDRG